MNKQRGLALSGLLLWGIIITLVAVLGMKVGPEYLEYYRIYQSVNKVAAGASNQTVAEIKAAFDRSADVNYIGQFKGSDLDISKENNSVVISFAYERRIPLFYNVSLVIDFEGSSKGSE